ncbi:hypothetical protein J6590_085155 [Homalodisca vitripennis]|nr:hypothetical protein J6590_085155 [Homalodisca vitripennis]
MEYSKSHHHYSIDHVHVTSRHSLQCPSKIYIPVADILDLRVTINVTMFTITNLDIKEVDVQFHTKFKLSTLPQLVVMCIQTDAHKDRNLW